MKSFPFLLLALVAFVMPVVSRGADEYESRVYTEADGSQLNYRLLKPRDFRSFVDARNWRVAVIEPKGVLTIYDTHGKRIWSVADAGALQNGWIVGNSVVGQQGRQIAVFTSHGPRIVTTILKHALLTDVAGGLAVYTVQSSVHVLRLSDGRDRTLATVKGLQDAQITPAGVFYGFVIPKSSDGSVTFVPLTDVLRKLR